MQNVEWYFYIMLTIWIVLILLPDRDFIAPEFVFCSSMVLCSGAYIYIQDFWSKDFNDLTYNIFLISSIIFILCGRLLAKVFRKDTGVYKSPSLIVLNKYLVNAIIVVASITCIVAIAMIFNHGGMTTYRDMRVNHELDGTFLLNQLIKCLVAYSYIAVYAILNNKVFWNINISKQKRIVISILLSNAAELLVSMGRQGIIELLFFYIIMSLFLNYKKSKSFSIPTKFILVLCAIVPVFYFGAEYVGRDFERISRNGMLYYVSLYLSCGINFFNSYIVLFPSYTEYFGQSSFSSLYSDLLIGKLLPNTVEALSYHEFSADYGNTVTIFGRWYEDWGIAGVFIMTVIVSMFYSCLYNKYVKYSKKFNAIMLIIYVRLVIALIWSGYDDRFSFIVSINMLSRILLILLFYNLLLKIKIKSRTSV